MTYRAHRAFTLLTLAVVMGISLPAFAQDQRGLTDRSFLGMWFRTEGGRTVEFLEITQGPNGTELAFRNRIDGPVASRARGKVMQDELQATGQPRLIRMKLTGPNEASYVSTDPGALTPGVVSGFGSDSDVSWVAVFLATQHSINRGLTGCCTGDRAIACS